MRVTASRLIIRKKKMFSWLKNDNRCFTLVEMVVSILILGIVAGAMVGVSMIGRMSIAKANHYMQAMGHAQAAMEQLMINETFSLPDGDIKNSAGSFSFTPTTPVTGINPLVVTITWNERSLGGSGQVSEQLTTLVVRK